MISHEPIWLVDVGCRGGIHPRWKSLGNKLQIIGFDVDANVDNRIGLKEGVYFPVILYSRSGTVKFYVTKDKNCSSVYPPNIEFMSKFVGSEHLALDKIIEVDCDTLDNFLEKQHLDDVDFLKIDAQGAELDVLKGSEKTLETVVGVECEVEFSSIYLNQPLFCDVDKFLCEKEFILFDLDVYRYFRTKKIQSKGQVLYADALYLKDESKIEKSKINKTVEIAKIYGHYDIIPSLLDCLEKRP